MRGNRALGNGRYATGSAARWCRVPAWFWVLSCVWAAGTSCPASAEKPGTGGGRPPEILSWRHVVLPEADYVRLAGEWEAWVKEHPSDIRGMVSWGDALRFSQNRDKALEVYARAFRADSTNAAAIDGYVGSRITDQATDPVLAHKRLLRAAQADPGYAPTYYVLWLASLRVGDSKTATTSLKRMLELGDMPLPLFDCGYNLLAGAPPQAIVFTNGDNDTYPPLAVQAQTGFRKDVTIVNLSLLNTEWYIRYLRDSGVPFGLDDAAVAKLAPTKEQSVSAQAQLALIRAAGARPVLYAVTVPEQGQAAPGDRRAAGLLLEILPAGGCGQKTPSPCIDLDRTRALLDASYRLDSMTDPLIDWTREATVARLGMNYVQLLTEVGDGLLSRSPREDGGPYLLKAVRISAFHGNQEQAEAIVKGWEEKEPGAPLLQQAKQLLQSR